MNGPILIAVALGLELRPVLKAADQAELACFPARPRPWVVQFGDASYPLRRSGPGVDNVRAARSLIPTAKPGPIASRHVQERRSTAASRGTPGRAGGSVVRRRRFIVGSCNE